MRNKAENITKLLLVEDNPEAVTKIKQYISRIDVPLTLDVCFDAGSAYTLAREQKFDLFVLDIQLTDYKGTNLARQLRKLPEYKCALIIFESALAGEELNAYRELRCYSFLIKPYTEEEFCSALSDALGLSSKLGLQEKHIRIEQKQFILDYKVSGIAYIEAFGKKLTIHTGGAYTGMREDTVSGYRLTGI